MLVVLDLNFQSFQLSAYINNAYISQQSLHDTHISAKLVTRIIKVFSAVCINCIQDPRSCGTEYTYIYIYIYRLLRAQQDAQDSIWWGGNDEQRCKDICETHCKEHAAVYSLQLSPTPNLMRLFATYGHWCDGLYS
jgi:hypothetical protein